MMTSRLCLGAWSKFGRFCEGRREKSCDGSSNCKSNVKRFVYFIISNGAFIWWGVFVVM
jgi:hypothetical protein